MVGTICPMVHGASTRSEGAKILIMHGLGSLVGATVMGGVIGTLGAIVLGGPGRNRTFGFVLTALLCTVYILDDLEIVRFPHPQSRRRVPSGWRLGSHNRAAWLYGLALGVGVGTPIPLSLFYIAIAWCAAISDPLVSALVFLGFGIGRALPILLLSRCRTDEEALSIMNSVNWNLSSVRFINKCALTFSASVLFFISIRI